MLNFNRTAALERSHIAVGGEAKRIPEANWCLNPKFILERPQWRTSVEYPITISRSSKAVGEAKRIPEANWCLNPKFIKFRRQMSYNASLSILIVAYVCYRSECAQSTVLYGSTPTVAT